MLYLYVLGHYPYAKCFICRETGHLSSKCPTNPRGLYPDGKREYVFMFISKMEVKERCNFRFVNCIMQILYFCISLGIEKQLALLLATFSIILWDITCRIAVSWNLSYESLLQSRDAVIFCEIFTKTLSLFFPCSVSIPLKTSDSRYVKDACYWYFVT